MSKRAYSILDLKNTSQPLKTGQLSNIGVSAFFIYYDTTLGYFALAGRGDSQVEFYQYDPTTENMIDKLSSYKFNDVTTFFTMLPKESIDCNKNEIGRCARIGQKKWLEHYSFNIPSRLGGYNKEFYPPFIGNNSSNTAAEWISGVDKEPVKTTLEPASKTGAAKGLGGLSRLNTLGGSGSSAPAPAAASASG